MAAAVSEVRVRNHHQTTKLTFGGGGRVMVLLTSAFFLPILLPFPFPFSNLCAKGQKAAEIHRR
jgi:hypothetical protein